jgi:K+-transporting ATPase KdpF subunit
MNVVQIVLLAISVLMFGYIGYALIRPERF